MRNDWGVLYIILFYALVALIITAFIPSCSIEYDAIQEPPPPDSIIGTSCQNEGEERMYRWGDFYYCAYCAKNGEEDLVWDKMVCPEEEVLDEE